MCNYSFTVAYELVHMYFLTVAHELGACIHSPLYTSWDMFKYSFTFYSTCTAVRITLIGFIHTFSFNKDNSSQYVMPSKDKLSQN